MMPWVSKFEVTPWAQLPIRGRRSVRIATYNVNGINGRLANLVAWLRDTAPDIACVQELKAPDEKFPAAAIRTAGYGAVWHGEKAWNGVGDPAARR
jgi:exonuclease III